MKNKTNPIKSSIANADFSRLLKLIESNPLYADEYNCIKEFHEMDSLYSTKGKVMTSFEYYRSIKKLDGAVNSILAKL